MRGTDRPGATLPTSPAMTAQLPPDRLLLTGPFDGRQSDAARQEVCRYADAGARDVLYVAANGTARRAIVADLVRRRQAVFGVRVVTLRALPAEIERRLRVRSPEPAGGVVEEVVTERAVRMAAAGFPDVPIGGLAARVSRTIADVERAGGSREAVAEALAPIGDLGDGARVLLDAWKHVEQWRPGHTRTAAAAFVAATALVREHGAAALGKCSLLCLEDLPLASRVERELVAALVAAAGCPVVATSACAAQLRATPATRSLAALREMAAWREVACLPADDRFAGALERLFVPGAEATHGAAPPLRITCLEAAGDAAEVRLAARVVQRHLREGGERACRPSDVLLVTHGRGRYHALIAEIFGAAGIPVALPRDRTVADTGLGGVLLDLLELAVHPDRANRERSLALTRAAHLDVPAAAADRLERSVRTGGYLGLDGWDDLALRALGARATNRVNRLKRAVATAHAGVAAAASAADLARVARGLAKELRLVGNAYFARRRTARAAPDDALVGGLGDAAVREDNQAWERIEETLDETMPELLVIDPALAARRGVALADGWLALFRRALDAQSPGMERPLADAVRVAGTAAGDGQPARVTIVLGLLEKRFPRQHRQDPFLRDDVRRHLNATLGLALPTTEDAGDAERECFVRAIATPSEALYLSYAATDEAGKPAVASFFLEDLQRAVGREHQFGRERLGVGDVAPRVQHAASQAELLAAVSHDIWQRLPRTVAAEAQRAAAFAAYNALAARGAALVPITRGRAAAARPAFDPALFVAAPHATLELSASQLRSLGHCTYKHFVEKVLAPESLDAPAYDALQKGTLVHDAMMAWIALGGWDVGEAALPRLDAWIEDKIAAYPAAMRDGPLARFQLDEDRARVLDFIRGELALIAGVPGFRPRYNELAFGGRSLANGERDPASVPTTFDLAVPTSAGERLVRFTGSVDRLDVLERDGQTLGIAVDYKTGKTSRYYADAMLGGTELQLRLYLLALEQIWGITPAGALYVGFGDGVRRGVLRADVADFVGGSGDPKCVRLLQPDEWRAFLYEETPRLIEPLIDRLVRLDIVARPRDGDCGFCELGPLCRYDRFAPELPRA